MTGRWAQQNPDLMKRIVDEGHEVINHTWSHSSFTGFSAGRPMSVYERRLELDRTEEFLVELTGKSTRPYFRPPYGDLDGGALKDVADAGYDYTMMWTIDSFGWMRIPAAADRRALPEPRRARRHHPDARRHRVRGRPGAQDASSPACASAAT